MRRILALSVVALAFVACRSASRGGSNGGGGAAARVVTPADVTPANVTLGDSLFNTGSCQRCHGAKGIGGPRGPVLTDNQWDQLATGSFDEIVAVITTGVPKEKIKVTTRPNAMNPRGGPMRLTDPQVKALAAYVWTLSHPTAAKK